jgi:hypothetical protein
MIGLHSIRVQLHTLLLKVGRTSFRSFNFNEFALERELARLLLYAGFRQVIKLPQAPEWRNRSWERDW